MAKVLGLPPLRNRGLVKAMEKGNTKGAAFTVVLNRSESFRSELPTLVRNAKSGQLIAAKQSKKK